MEAENPKIVRVLVGIPNEGNTPVDAYDNRMVMFQHLGHLETLSRYQIKQKEYSYPEGIHFEFGLGTVGNILTPIAREKIAEIATEKNFDYILFVDDDMIVPEDLFERLYAHQKDIVGALAFTRFAPHKPVIYIMEEGFDPVEKKNYYTSQCWWDYPKNQLVECDAVGFGAVLINTRVFKKIKRPWFTAATGKGEDIQFCHEARHAGIKVYMDTATKLGHLGPPINVTEEVYESQPDIEVTKEQFRKLNGQIV